MVSCISFAINCLCSVLPIEPNLSSSVINWFNIFLFNNSRTMGLIKFIWNTLHLQRCQWVLRTVASGALHRPFLPLWALLWCPHSAQPREGQPHSAVPVQGIECAHSCGLWLGFWVGGGSCCTSTCCSLAAQPSNARTCFSTVEEQKAWCSEVWNLKAL